MDKGIFVITNGTDIYGFSEDRTKAREVAEEFNKKGGRYGYIGVGNKALVHVVYTMCVDREHEMIKERDLRVCRD